MGFSEKALIVASQCCHSKMGPKVYNKMNSINKDY